VRPSVEAGRGSELPSQAGIPSRYRLLRELGGGGMAVVYEVLDPLRGRVALKRLRVGESPDHISRLRDLFAREFHTLSQLAHPRIVQVYDYGLDATGPYYTMELLDGGDLQQAAPAEALRVCGIARDICSALSLLHSRHMVHRDVSPRNVRCTADGTAKLIDFGALATMGHSADLVGTPAYCAPEALSTQPLDARTDLYALGATVYFVLTGRHAFPVREFASLAKAWTLGFPRPSELVAGIPAALDALVLDLLQLDPNARPRSAAEVMERLAVIEGKPLQEHLLVAQAYLSTPLFLGRDKELEQIEQYMTRRRGASLLIHGPAGVGSTRLLDASLLAAKLRGVTPLRADAQDAEHEHGVAGALLTQLLQVAPDATRELAADDLRVLSARPAEPAPSTSGRPPTVNVAAAHAALRRLLLATSNRIPLAIGIDDLPRMDPASAALLALLAREAHDAPITIIATSETGALKRAGAAQNSFAESARHIQLQNFGLEATHGLLGSIFGESPELEGLVQRLYEITAGNPRDLLRFSQHLVDHHVLRYSGGAWMLPARFDLLELPASVSQILSGRLSELTSSARSLARAWALIPQQSLSVDDLAVLAQVADRVQLTSDLAQLEAADIAQAGTGQWRLRDRAWIPILLDALAPSETQELHRRLARMFEQRGGEEFRVAAHLLRGGEVDRAIDALIAHAALSQTTTDRDPDQFYRLVYSLPADWQDTYETALRMCQQSARPQRDIFALRVRLLHFINVKGFCESPHIAELIRELRRASGLDDWQALDPSLPAGPRLAAAVDLAEARFASTPEEDRVVDPATAARMLTFAVSDCTGVAALQQDLAAILAFPSLEPFAPMSPVVRVIEQLVAGVRARLSGRLEQARAIYLGLLERGAASGLTETRWIGLKMRVSNTLGMIEASLGLASSMERARALENSGFRVEAEMIGMLTALFQGSVLDAERHRRKIQRLRLESTFGQGLEHSHLLWQVTAFGAMDDLTHLKRVNDELDRVPSKSLGWSHVRAYARAEFQRVRGDLAAADLELTAQLAEIGAGDHQLWAHIAGARVNILYAQGRLDEAVADGRRYLEDAERAQLGIGACAIRMPLAIAEARLGLPDAIARADHVIHQLLELGATGLNLGLAFETRARVALEQSDRAGYEAFSERCKVEFSRGLNPALAARYQRLRRAAQQKAAVSIAPPPTDSLTAAIRWKARIRSCENSTERAQMALAWLSEQTGARDGFLYYVVGEDAVLVAGTGMTREPPEVLSQMVRDYLAAESAGDGATRGSEAPAADGAESPVHIEALYRPVLLSHSVDQGFAISGVAVFVVEPERRFPYPGEAAAQLSQLMVEVGDVTSLVIGDD
jgi:tRNA A-37 threonylcarbamoyl transferase component Bud32